MDDLDEMLLAVTDKSKNINKDKEYHSSDSGGGDSDYESEDSGREEDDDDKFDDGDEEMEPDDDDDDDYSMGNKRKKKKAARPVSKKARTTGMKKKADTKRKKKAPARQRAKINLEDVDDDDEDEFQFEYDEQGYGDEADRARLMQMTEVERETMLEERIRRRAQQKELWEISRKIQKRDRGPEYSGDLGARRSGRSRVNTKIAAMDDMLDKANNKSKLADLSDADDEPDRRRSRDDPTRGSPRRGSHDKNSERISSPKHSKFSAPKQDRGRELGYNDLVKDTGANITTTLLFARRDVLVMLSQRPGFARAVKGLFVRVRVSDTGNAYLLCRVVGVETARKPYKVHDVRTDYLLILRSGKQNKSFSIEWCSGSHPTRHEFDTYRSRLLQAGAHLPDRDDLNDTYKKAEEFIVRKNPQVSDAERREHREHHERLYPEQVNWTVKRTEVQMSLDVLQQDYEVQLRKPHGRNSSVAEEMAKQIKKLTGDLTKCQAMEAKYVRKDASSNAKIFQELAAKNRAENRRMEKLAHTHKKLTAGSGNSGKINPYARFETTGMSYYSVGKDIKKESRPSMQELKNDWRSSLKTWKYGDTKRSISANVDNSTKKKGSFVVQKQFTAPVAGLDDLVWPPTKEMRDVVVKKCSSLDAVYVRTLRKKKRMEMRKEGHKKDEEAKKTITFEEWMQSNKTV